MAVADRAERARGSFERRAWGEAFDQLSAAHREGQLDLEDLERLAVAAHMVGRGGDCEEAWMGAHHAWLRSGERNAPHAVRSGRRSGSSSAATWLRRWAGSPAADGVLGDSRRDCVEQGWLRMLTALPPLFEGDADVYSSFVDAGEIAERFADPDATMFARSAAATR